MMNVIRKINNTEACMKKIPKGTQVIHYLSFWKRAFYKEENNMLMLWNQSGWERASFDSIETMIQKNFELVDLRV